MSTYTGNTLEETIHSSSHMDTSASIRFFVYLVIDVLSIFCSLFVLYHLLFDRALRRVLSNHAIIVLLVIGLISELISVPWHLYDIHHDIPWLQTPVVYLLRFFLDYGIYTTQMTLFAWTTIERHILIFHEQWVLTRRKRLFIHYLPIVIILTYCIVYYAIIAFMTFCENSFDIQMTGGAFVPCVLSETMIGTWDIIVHQIAPPVIIVISSVTFIGRVLKPRRRLNQRVQWRKYRKMTIQLLLMLLLYLVFNSSWIVMIVILRYGLSDNPAQLPILHIIFLRNYVIFFFPFVCCGSLPQFRSRFKRLFLFWHRHQQIVPHIPFKTVPQFGSPIVNIMPVVH